MNIHILALTKMAKILGIAALVGAIVGFVTNHLTAEELMTYLSFGFIGFLIVMMYAIFYDEARHEIEKKK
jgi:uncharacterized membrane protein YfcA